MRRTCEGRRRIRYRAGGGETRAVSTPSGLKPGSMATTLRKLVKSSAAPTSSMNANATWLATSTRRTVRVARPLVPLRLSSRNAWLRFMCRSWRTGTSPTSTPTSERDRQREQDDRGVHVDLGAARQPIQSEAGRARQHGLSDGSPSAPPATVSTTVSVSSWRVRRGSAAPSACRVASSLIRARRAHEHQIGDVHARQSAARRSRRPRGGRASCGRRWSGPPAARRRRCGSRR